MARAVMARPKRRKDGEPGKGFKTVGFRVSNEFDAWLKGLAEEHRPSVAGILDRAVTEWAEVRGYPAKPPKR